MNYTEKYHLPQWEETDRIMRTDFNQMCADMESGLNAGQADCAEKTAELRESSLDSLFRAARNHYFLAASESPMPSQIGVFCQKVEGTRLPEGVSGMMMKDGHGWMTWAGEGFTPEEFKKSLHVDSHLQVVYGEPERAVPLVISFTAKGLGYLKSIGLTISYYVGASGTCSFAFSVKDLTTQKAVSGTSYTQTTRTGSPTSFATLYPNISMENGHTYEIRLTPQDANFNATTSLHDFVSIDVKSYHAPSTTLAYRFSEQETSRGGLALVRRNLGEAGSTADLYWDGKLLQPARIRTITDQSGQTVQEAEYRRTEPVPAESSLELRLNCAENGSIHFYEWGAILI